jgi:Reverse transcriptase (RNA-dependent DNA polymerase)
VFSETPGLCNQLQHEIKISDDFAPKRLKPYKIPEKFKPQVDREIQELLRLGLIQESNSPMTSPLVCIMKPNSNDIRLVVDFRYLNGYTIADPVGPPDMLSVIQRIGNAKYITTFDGKSSYWTIPIKPEDRWLTAFLCDDGSEYEWTRAAFGLKNSGSSFVRMLNKALQPIRQFAASFVDDCAIYSNEWEDHLKHVDRFLQVIQQCGLTLTLKKSEFAKSEVKFCGQIIGSGNRRIDPDKMRAISEIKKPENKRNVRQLLGIFGWYRYHDIQKLFVRLLI